MLSRLSVTPEALEVITLLEEKFGPLMFYQAGGCCEGTQPQCFEKGGFMLRTGDVCIGQIKGYDFVSTKIYLNIGNIRILPLMSPTVMGLVDFHWKHPTGKRFK